jgi:hypothetical protein
MCERRRQAWHCISRFRSAASNTNQQATVIKKTVLGSKRLGTCRLRPQTRIEIYRDIRKLSNATQYTSALEEDSHIDKGLDIPALSYTSIRLEIISAAASTVRDAAALLCKDHAAPVQDRAPRPPFCDASEGSTCIGYCYCFTTPKFRMAMLLSLTFTAINGPQPQFPAFRFVLVFMTILLFSVGTVFAVSRGKLTITHAHCTFLSNKRTPVSKKYRPHQKNIESIRKQPCGPWDRTWYVA